MPILFYGNLPIPVDDEEEHRLNRSIGRIRVGNILNECNAAVVRFPAPFNDPRAVKVVPQPVRRQQQQPAGFQMRGPRRYRRRQVGLGQHIVHRIIDDGHIKRHSQPHRPHIALVVRRIGVERARQLQHLRRKVNRRSVKVRRQLRQEMPAAAAQLQQRRPPPVLPQVAPAADQIQPFLRLNDVFRRRADDRPQPRQVIIQTHCAIPVKPALRRRPESTAALFLGQIVQRRLNQGNPPRAGAGAGDASILVQKHIGRHAGHAINLRQHRIGIVEVGKSYIVAFYEINRRGFRSIKLRYADDINPGRFQLVAVQRSDSGQLPLAVGSPGRPECQQRGRTQRCLLHIELAAIQQDPLKE